MESLSKEDKKIEKLQKFVQEDLIAHGAFEIDETIWLHPSLDITEDLTIVGFRIRDEKRKMKNMFLVFQDNGRAKILFKKEFEYNQRKFYIDTKNRLLELLGNRLNFIDIKNYLGEDPNFPLENAGEIFETVKELFKKYVELGTKTDYTLVTAWSIGTYFFIIFWAFPFLNPKGPKGSGKSQFLSFQTQICFNSKKARPTVAALGDTVDSLRGTYLIDQADSLHRKENEEILEILADSYKKGGGKRRIVSRTENGERKVVEYETYSPKIFASIKELPEDLRDRCIVIPLIKSSRNFPEPDEQSENWKEIRGRMYKLLHKFKEVIKIYRGLKEKYEDSPEMVGRIRELWLPLETIMIFCKVNLEEIEKVKKLFLSRYGYTEYEPSEFEEEVVKTILTYFQEETEKILTPKEISEAMDFDTFPNIETPQKRATGVGWVIKKFNLSSEKLPRRKEGMRYRFNKEKIERIYRAYFKAEGESTQSYTEEKKEISPEQLEM